MSNASSPGPGQPSTFLKGVDVIHISRTVERTAEDLMGKGATRAQAYAVILAVADELFKNGPIGRRDT
jgi:hypothetical protein